VTSPRSGNIARCGPKLSSMRIMQDIRKLVEEGVLPAVP
jgi:hypothetical protein